jgi:hypothetical protein
MNYIIRDPTPEEKKSVDACKEALYKVLVGLQDAGHEDKLIGGTLLMAGVALAHRAGCPSPEAFGEIAVTAYRNYLEYFKDHPLEPPS